jgi:hypothetical protein
MNPEQEWRQHLLGEIKDIKKDVAEVKAEMTTLKVKVALFSSVIGSVASIIINKLFS